jgi:TP901 family phage tail tape measure protein
MSNLDVSLRLKLINMIKGPALAAGKDLEQLKKTLKSMNGTGGGADKLGKDMKQAAIEAKNSSRAFDFMNTKVGDLGKNKGVAKLKADLSLVSGEAERASKAMARMQIAAQKLNKPVGGGLGGGLALLGGGGKARLNKKAYKVQKKHQDQEQKTISEHMQEGGKNFIGHASKAFVGAYLSKKAIEKTVGQAIEYQADGTQMEISMKNSTPEKIAYFKRQAQIEAMRYGFTQGEALKGYGEALADGVPEKELVQFSNLAAKAAISFSQPVHEMSHMIATLRNQKQTNLPDTEKYLNRVAVLSHNSPVKGAEILDMMNRSQQAAHNAGFDEKTTMSIVTALKAGGTDVETAGTFMRNFSISVAQAASDNKKGKGKKKGFAELGIDPAEFMKELKVDSGKAFNKFLIALGKSNNPTSIADSIAGAYGVTPLLSLVKEFATLNKYMQAHSDADTHPSMLNKGLEIKQAMVQNQMQRFSAALNANLISLGDKVLPSISTALEIMNRQNLRAANAENLAIIQENAYKKAGGEHVDTDEEKQKKKQDNDDMWDRIWTPPWVNTKDKPKTEEEALYMGMKKRIKQDKDQQEELEKRQQVLKEKGVVE